MTNIIPCPLSFHEIKDKNITHTQAMKQKQTRRTNKYKGHQRQNLWELFQIKGNERDLTKKKLHHVIQDWMCPQTEFYN